MILLKPNVQLKAFPPILPAAAHTLILGTMPGEKSLQVQQYYAHPQNQFWKFMGALFGAHLSLPYDQRVQILKDNHIAVWDVLSSCTRIGSMDAAIQNAVVNDFEMFFQHNPTIQTVIFDSATAEKIYLKHVSPDLTHTLNYKRVPSPSPAYASMSYDKKLILWAEAFR